MSELHERIEAAKARSEAEAENEPGEEEAAEQEEGQPAAPPEPEPTPEPEPPGGMEAEQVGELEKAATAYIKRVNKVFAPGDPPPTCAVCEGLGFDLTGGLGAPEFASDDQFRGCDRCRGLGQVATGSKVIGQETRDCPDCMGRGYLEKLPAPAAVAETPQEYGTPAWMGNAAGAPPG